MQTPATTVQFPFLIHRDETAIESEKKRINKKHTETEAQLQRLKKALTDWMQKEVDVLEFVTSGNFENTLLKNFGQLNGIPAYVKLDKYNELYHVPNYSKIIEDATALAALKTEMLALYVGQAPNDFIAPEISESEETQIVERHSVYVRTEEEYKRYSALESLCHFINYVNVDLDPNGIGTTMSPYKIKEFTAGLFQEHIIPTPQNSEKPVWCVNFGKFRK